MSDRDWREEHEADPPDFADSYALLDDGQVCCEVEPIDRDFTGSEAWDHIRSSMRRRRVDSHHVIEDR